MRNLIESLTGAQVTKNIQDSFIAAAMQYREKNTIQSQAARTVTNKVKTQEVTHQMIGHTRNTIEGTIQTETKAEKAEAKIQTDAIKVLVEVQVHLPTVTMTDQFTEMGLMIDATMST